MPIGWIHCAGDVSKAEPTVAALRSIGLAPRDDRSTGPGVVIIGPDLERACREIHRHSRAGRERVLVVAPPGHTDASESWTLLGAGAADVVGWRDREPPLAEIAARLQRWTEVDQVLDSPVVGDNLIGPSTTWRAAVRRIVEVARFTTASLLIQGESGTGKELGGRLVHALDARADKRELVILDCSTLVPELAGSEFFGHERGAFTGAAAAREGAFELARGGTLFLDEVGELPLPLQAQLLRVVQERTFKRLGSNTWQQTDFRLVCATNRDLVTEVAAGRFRADLYYRIATWVCHLPPLRERTEDILPLARHFLAAALGTACVPQIEESVRDLLLSRPYPGNVRELRQVVTRIAARHVGSGPITPGDVPVEDRPRPDAARAASPDDLENAVRQALGRGATLKDIGRGATETAIRLVVEEEGGNLQRAARRLQVTDRALQLRRNASGGARHGE